MQLVIYLFALVLVTASHPVNKKDSLVLLHVLFRHGNRTANGPGELYPKDPYLNETYYPVGLGQLTNEGKRKEYSIGKTLRETYGRFLGEYYYPEIVEAQSTDYNRTKMSLELVLASLFAPRGKQIWNREFSWQPVPYNYLPRPKDKVLMGVECPNYLKLYNKHVQSLQQQNEFREYQELFDYVSKNSGLNVTRFLDIYNLYFGLSTEEEWGFKLPEWTEFVWPEALTFASIKEYFVSTATTPLRRMASGYLLEKVIADTREKISGGAKGKKLYLYSAHENNIAELLIALDVFDLPHIPTYGSYVVFEVHQMSYGYGIKIYYENYTKNKPQLLKLPACDTICPFNKFVAIMEENLPTKELCGIDDY